jgi:hypothetical protein
VSKQAYVRVKWYCSGCGKFCWPVLVPVGGDVTKGGPAECTCGSRRFRSEEAAA